MWRWMKKQTLRKVMMMSRKCKRMNCEEMVDLHHPENQTLNWLLLCSLVRQKPIKIRRRWCTTGNAGIGF